MSEQTIQQQMLAECTNRIGAKYEEFQAEVIAAGWLVRVRSRDGKSLIGTHDFRPNRINIAIVDGCVSDVFGCG